MDTTNQPTVYRVPDGAVRGVMLSHVRDLLRPVRTRRVKASVPVDGDYRQLYPAELPEAGPVDEAYRQLAADTRRLAAEFPDTGALLDRTVARLSIVLDHAAPVARLWTAYRAVLDDLAGDLGLALLDPDCAVVPAGEHLEVWFGPDQGPTRRLLKPSGYLTEVARLSAAARRTGRRPTVPQLVAEQFAFDVLARGHRTGRRARPYGTSGFRDHQTYMSVTDPGEGHLDGTVRDSRYLDGVIVHIEHLERGSTQNRADVEPYRIPHPHAVARVRQVLGTDAPASSYVGRPVFEGAVDASMLKAAHTVAAACSALFAEGLAECKLAIEGMTASQAVHFMRAVRAGTQRDRFSQVLSAAFNLNSPVLDDRGSQPHDARLVSGRVEVGLLGVELTRAGGFDKVTWDGTANTYPSRCVLEQLSAGEALTLVHRAHEVGLLTYFSAGFRLQNLAQAVYTGVDGVGVGGAQILRYMDRHTGFHGPFLEENIPAILSTRDQAERDPRGQAAAALARLDRMAYEGSLSTSDDRWRGELFAALGAADVDGRRLAYLLDRLAHVVQAPLDTDQPLLGWARRLRRAGTRAVAARGVPAPDWQRHLDQLGRAVAARDADRLDLLLSTVVTGVRTAVPELQAA